ncbi:MAG TPA: PaaI family thioesterase [Pyrinomonadaceae bacterium]|nr:PaaI family thioesterase [Pyrinomonadaceae bacterium]
MSAANVPVERLRLIERAIDLVPYAKLLGIKLDHVKPGEATLRLPVRHELTQNHGVVHGGAIASIIDSATAFAVLTLIEPTERVTTVDLTISYLRPATEGDLIATAKVMRQGRRLFSVTADAIDQKDRLLATALTTYIKL